VDEDRRAGEDGGSDALNGRADGPRTGADPSFEPLPASLRQRLDRCADDWLHECAARRGAKALYSRGSGLLPWLVAAASLVLAVVGWWPRLVELEASAAVSGNVAQWQAQRARQSMLATPGVAHVAWDGAADVNSGDVVWDPRQQRGFLRLRGFVANDPQRAQYQLWIFDAGRDDRYPVDGGVFDVPAGHDEVLVPVHPTLPVSRAVAFAVTIESPGGAMVSNRDKVVAFARAGG